MKAFTLIEVMISLFILLAGMSGVIKLQATSAAMTKLSGDLTYAQNLADTAVQTQLSRPITKVNSAGTECILDGSERTTMDVTFKKITYTVTCTLTLNKTPLLGGNKSIGNDTASAVFVNVDVTWTDLLGNESHNKHAISSYGVIIKK